MNRRRLLVVGLAAFSTLVVAACFRASPRVLPSAVRVLYSSEVQDTLGSQVDIYFLVARQGNELRLTGDAGADRQPVFASEIRRVFFTREVEGVSEIWSMDLDGGGQRRVAGGSGASYLDPAPSPDEQRIAYTVRTPGGGSRVEIANVDGSDARVRIGDNARWSQPAWSPDGSRLAVVGDRDGTPRVHLLDVDGGAPRPLGPGSTRESEPDWSPDGRSIALVKGSGSDAEIFVVDVESGEGKNVSNNDVEDAGPAWSPSGERIVFASLRPHGRWNLWMIDPDGGGLTSLTRSESAEARDPEWI